MRRGNIVHAVALAGGFLQCCYSFQSIPRCPSKQLYCYNSYQQRLPRRRLDKSNHDKGRRPKVLAQLSSCTHVNTHGPRRPRRRLWYRNRSSNDEFSVQWYPPSNRRGRRYLWSSNSGLDASPDFPDHPNPEDVATKRSSSRSDRSDLRTVEQQQQEQQSVARLQSKVMATSGQATATDTMVSPIVSPSSPPPPPSLLLPPISSVLLLNCVAVIWGSQHAIIKSVIAPAVMDDAPTILVPGVDTVIGILPQLSEAFYATETATVATSSLATSVAATATTTTTTDPAAFTLLRFGLAALLASPYTPRLPFWDSNDSKDESASVLARRSSSDSLVDSRNVNDFDGDKDKSGTVVTFTATTSSVVSSSSMSNEAMTTWRWGLEMGLWMFLGFCLQAIGLQYTTAQRSGFLLYLNVKFVPFLARILYQREISLVTWVSALTAFTGTALLAYTSTGTLPTTTGTEVSATTLWDNFSLNTGDWYTMAAAVASAMFILRLERASSQVKDGAGLNAASLWVVAALSAVWTMTTRWTTGTDGVNDVLPMGTAVLLSELWSIASSHPFELLYLGGVATALANWIQTKAQRDISAERASVIYAMDPVYGAMFSYAILGETLNGVTGWIGAGLITLAAATNAFLESSSRNPESSLVERREDLLADGLDFQFNTTAIR